MHRLFLGCNLWNALFLLSAAYLGITGSPQHARVSIFASVFACLVQSAVIALFIGAAKLTKEHVGRFDMPASLIGRVNRIYHRLFPMAAIGVALTAAASILGGAAHLGRVPMWLHVAPAAAAALYLIAIIPFEYVLQARMHEVILDVEKLLPPADQISAAPSRPGYRPDEVVLDRAGRAKALLYVGLTLPLPYLGYTFISGHDVSFLLVPTVVLTVACLGAAVHQHLASRRAGPQR
ncbi:MAG TPA: hypothetical protein VFE84_13830 [Patescibacteria group bacterium]|jgi:hypothetical protein|nr:hypothetical protein [Patescibacteria group bacterium]